MGQYLNFPWSVWEGVCMCVFFCECMCVSMCVRVCRCVLWDCEIVKLLPCLSPALPPPPSSHPQNTVMFVYYDSSSSCSFYNSVGVIISHFFLSVQKIDKHNYEAEWLYLLWAVYVEACIVCFGFDVLFLFLFVFLMNVFVQCIRCEWKNCFSSQHCSCTRCFCPKE